MKDTDEKIENVRQKLIDYYGSATALFSMATADVIRVEQMSEDEILKEAKRIGIILERINL